MNRNRKWNASLDVDIDGAHKILRKNNNNYPCWLAAYKNNKILCPSPLRQWGQCAVAHLIRKRLMPCYAQCFDVPQPEGQRLKPLNSFCQQSPCLPIRSEIYMLLKLLHFLRRWAQVLGCLCLVSAPHPPQNLQLFQFFQSFTSKYM